MADSNTTRRVFIAGGTGFMGQRLIPALLARGHVVTALVRPGSENKLAPGCAIVVGNALDAASYAQHVRPADTFVHLVGVSHPNPSKAKQFREVDLGALRASVAAAVAATVENFVFVSVAQPAPVMQGYLEVRAECEAMIAASGLNATFLRPWYVLGPGRWWPYLLLPGYWIFERVPATREMALRLGLVTWRQMVAALVAAVEAPPRGTCIVDVPAIRQAYKGLARD